MAKNARSGATYFTRERVLHYNPLAKNIVRARPRVLSEIKAVITEQGAHMKFGEKFKTPSGIEIEKAASGSYKGGNNQGTYKVRLGKRTFFIKHSHTFERDIAKRFFEAQRVLKEQGGTVSGFRVKVIMPHLVYGTKNKRGADPQETFIVTDFFDETRVEQVADYRNRSVQNLNTPKARKEDERLRDVVDTIENLFESEGISMECRDTNLFYEKKKNTLWIFDL